VRREGFVPVAIWHRSRLVWREGLFPLLQNAEVVGFPPINARNAAN
jgi:hypothetical protein